MIQNTITYKVNVHFTAGTYGLSPNTEPLDSLDKNFILQAVSDMKQNYCKLLYRFRSFSFLASNLGAEED
jgi:hypothetical protein